MPNVIFPVKQQLANERQEKKDTLSLSLCSTNKQQINNYLNFPMKCVILFH